MTKEIIDITYDFRKDVNYNGSDVDKYSSTLKLYHKYLWSKPLPNGKPFILDDKKEYVYLYAKVDSQEFYLSSDTITHTYSFWKRTQNVIQQIPVKDIEHFRYIAKTIGGFIIFPCKEKDNKNHGNSINQKRGMNNKICDRFDLTLECIRRFYLGVTNPLFETLKRYDDFFELFSGFKGYCEHFLLQDLVDSDYSSVKFFLPFNDFESSPYPKSVDEYYSYKKNIIEFVVCRNNRINREIS